MNPIPPPLPLALLVFVVGACVGSFLNVCIARWPADLSVVAPRSRCPKCEREIRWYENIPVVSWLAMRARCAGCKLPISPIYPAIELAVALGWVAAFIAFGVSLVALRVAVLATILLGIAVTDAKHYLIPDGFTVFGLLWVAATAVAALAIGETGPFAGPYDALVGACAGAGAIAIAGWLGEVATKKEAMGFGDVTLMAVVGGGARPGARTAHRVRRRAHRRRHLPARRLPDRLAARPPRGPGLRAAAGAVRGLPRAGGDDRPPLGESGDRVVPWAPVRPQP